MERDTNVKQNDFVDSQIIMNFFRMLNEENIQYVIRNNLGNEIPNHLRKSKDIDLLIHEDDYSRFEEKMFELGCRKEEKADNRFLYGLKGDIMWYMPDYMETFRVHVFSKLSCKALLPFWIPLDKKIQKRIWEEKIWDKENEWWIVDNETRFVYLLVRCIFDKKQFMDVYIEDIKKYKEIIDMDLTKELLSTVFFKYTNRLLFMIDNNKFEDIIEDYISYSEY